MADREKVIKAWEIFRDSNPYEICSGREFRAIREPEYCMGQMIEDTIALLKEHGSVEHALEVLRKAGWTESQDVPFPAELLKEQEAVSIKTDYFDGFGNRTSHCPSCNSRLVWHQNKNYCGECGRSVKWE